MDTLIKKDIMIQQLEKLQEWLITELPLIIILIIGVLIFMKIIKFSLKRLNKTIIKRAQKNEKVDSQEAEKRINTLMGIVWGIIRIITIVTVLMIILQKIGINIAPILASAGIIGLAVGFGAQELVRDIISGFFILLENQIRTGDVAIINGTSGLVESIQLRTITLRDFSGIVHIFQNGKINSLSNRTKGWSAAIFEIGVAYKENVKQVMDIMQATGEELYNDPEFKEYILEPMEILGLDQFGSSAIIIKARVKTKPSMQWTIAREYNKRIKEIFDDKDIEIPFPHTTVYWGEKISPLQLKVNDK